MIANAQPGPEGSPKPKLVRIIGRLNVGGPARQACLLHEQLADCFQTRLIAGSLGAGEHDMSYLLSSERDVVRLPEMSREVSFGSDARAFWKIFRFLRRERPDIVHTHTAKAGALGRLAAWLAGVPIIIHTYHGHVFQGYFSPAKSRVYLAVERALGRLTTRVIAISKSQSQELGTCYRVVPREKLAVVQNGFELEGCASMRREDARRVLGLVPGDFVVTWAGRMAPIKDVKLLAEVIRRAERPGGRIVFLIVGDGTQRFEFESLVRDCGNVRFLGWRQDMELIWAASDAALLTSLNEGTPTALIEAMAACIPFVSTNVGAVRDLAAEPLRELSGVGHAAANGFLTRRAPEAIVACLETLAGDPEMARRMGAAAQGFALERFCAHRLVQEMRLLYQKLMDQESEFSATAVQPSENSASQAGGAI